ncbi:hypothetical protein [Mycobacterium sp.]|uniref:hypothetical protein n=1 Tax=Mycobacterium sp. TaxID=1785 RepID=UPI003C792620
MAIRSPADKTSAYWLFLASYFVAALLTWTVYVRRPAPAPPAPGAYPVAELTRV